MRIAKLAGHQALTEAGGTGALLRDDADRKRSRGGSVASSRVAKAAAGTVGTSRQASTRETCSSALLR